MPFQSQKQRALCYHLQSRGQAGSWDCAEWEQHTPSKLPERAGGKPKRKKQSATIEARRKIAAYLNQLIQISPADVLPAVVRVKRAFTAGCSLAGSLRHVGAGMSDADARQLAVKIARDARVL